MDSPAPMPPLCFNDLSFNHFSSPDSLSLNQKSSSILVAEKGRSKHDLTHQDELIFSTMSQTNTSALPAQPENTNGRSKPRAIIRLLSTKFTPRAVSAPTVRSPPPPPAPQQSAIAREQREAALRAVGLLPPLRANKDLSLQEMEQDKRIPIVPLAEVSERLSEFSSADAAATTDAQPSAADLIKKEWETKHRGTGTDVDVESSQRAKLNTFTFGGSSPSLVLPPSSSDLAIALATQAEGSLSRTSPDQLVTPPAQNPPSTPPDLPGSTSSSREIPPQNTTVLTPTPSRSQTAPMDSAPPSPYMVPLPLSAKPSYSSLRSKSSAPSSPPPNRELPPLPQTPTVPEMSLSASLEVAVRSVVDTPHSISIPSGSDGGESGNGIGAGSGTSTPRPRAAAASPNVQLSPPPIKVESPTTPQADGDDLFVAEDTTPLATPVPAPAAVQAAEEEVVENAANDSDDGGSNGGSPESISSIKTPSLDSSSQTTTSDSSSADVSPSVRPQLFAPGKTGGLHVKTTGAERVSSVVIASPVELHRFSEELDVVIEDDGEVPVEATEGKEDEENVEEMGQKPKAAELVLAEGGDKDGEGGIGTQTPKAPITSSNPVSAPSTSLTFPAALTPESVDANPTPKKTLMERRKTLNPFKRAQTLGAGSVKPQTQPKSSDQAANPNEPRRRLTVGSSLSNIRRSVVGSLSSKSKSSASTISSGSTRSSGNGKEKMFDASHLPASPTIPSSFVGSVGSRSSGGGGGGAGHFGLSPPPTPTRLARPVVIHTGGSILEQTQGIEDAETRRMTELAFM